MSNDFLTGAEAIIYRKLSGKTEFLVVRQKSSGNISFAGGMSEEVDGDTLDTIKRELEEEVNLRPDQYSLQDTGIDDEFVYGNHPTRAGKTIRKHVYLVELKESAVVEANLREVRDVFWVSREEALRIIWPGVRELFMKLTENI